MKVDVSTATASTMIGLFLIAYVVNLIWGMVRHFRLGNMIELGMMFGVMYVGWTIRTWPSRHKGDGMVMSLAMAWRDSIITLIYIALKLFGIVDAWHWIEGFFV